MSRARRLSHVRRLRRACHEVGTRYSASPMSIRNAPVPAAAIDPLVNRTHNLPR
jgi:hypothetical protein